MRVGVFGAAGRVGSAVCRAVDDDPDLELVAAVDPQHSGLDLRQVTGIDTPVQVSGGPDVLEHAGAEVAVDFTVIEGARENARWCAEHGVHAVIGTSGFTEADHEELRRIFTGSNCFIAPNFAIGAVLMMRFAEMAAPFFDSAEIIELHHDGKVDAPSATAIVTAEKIVAASGEWRDDPTTKVVVKGARGGSVGPIHVHSVRLHGLVAHQEVVLGTTGQTLSIRHDSYDRDSFMPGVLLACKKVASFPGLTVGLEVFLDL